MALSAQDARRLALENELASEAAHFDRIAFRTPRKIFATLGPGGLDINLMFDPEMQAFYCEQEPEAFAPIPGGWGKSGVTRCDLARVDEATLRSALLAAHALARPAQKTTRKRSRKPTEDRR